MNDELSNMRVHQFATASAEASAALGLPEREHGFLLCTDADGRYVTWATEDVGWVRSLSGLFVADLAAQEAEAPGVLPSTSLDLDVPGDFFRVERDYWPPGWEDWPDDEEAGR